MFHGSRRRAIREGLAALHRAETYTDWSAGAQRLDELLHLDEWRADDTSPFYDDELLRRQLAELRAARLARDSRAIVGIVQGELAHALNEIAEPQLYGTAFSGTKHLIGEFLDEVTRAAEALLHAPDLTVEEKRILFWRARRSFGRSALMLSGGGALGFAHLGVVRALSQAGLLPAVFGGASIGAIVGGVIASRTDAELWQLLDEPAQLARDGILVGSWREARARGSLLDPSQLARAVRANIDDYTFREAYLRSGRVLTIALSPTRRRQEPLLLSYLTTPDVLVASGALASSAIPGLFPPAPLRARGQDGRGYAHLPTERWIDGSFRADLPMEGVARLHNVSLFVVSQTNPHLLPFASRNQRSHAVAWQMMSSFASNQALQFTDLARILTRHTSLGPAVEAAHALVGQHYFGDIDIVPDIPRSMWPRVLGNTTERELQVLVRAGERSTWPRLQWISDRTRVRRLIERCVSELRSIEGRTSGEASTVPAEYRRRPAAYG